MKNQNFFPDLTNLVLGLIAGRHFRNLEKTLPGISVAVLGIIKLQTQIKIMCFASPSWSLCSSSSLIYSC